MRSLACLVVLLAWSPAVADDTADRCPQQDQPPAVVVVHIERRDGRDIHVIENRVILCGHPPRPGVAYVTTAKSINYEWEDLTQAFLPRTLRSVTKAPF